MLYIGLARAGTRPGWIFTKNLSFDVKKELGQLPMFISLFPTPLLCTPLFPSTSLATLPPVVQRKWLCGRLYTYVIHSHELSLMNFDRVLYKCKRELRIQ